MKIILSPAKNINQITYNNILISSKPIFQKEIMDLIQILKNKTIDDVSQLMKISKNLATLNFNRYQNFANDFNEKNSYNAILAFNGDVYKNIDKENLLKKENAIFIQEKLFIISGLYGILRPFDLIQPYRLEMGTNLINSHGKNLYKFWQEKLTKFINENTDDFIINLASHEYCQAINQNQLKAKFINIIFKEGKNKNYKTIGILAKKARGKMLNFIINNKINKPQYLQEFNENGYIFQNNISNESNLYFYRKI